MNILEEIQNCPVEWKELKDIAILKNGKDWKTLPSGEVPVYGSGGEMGEFVSEYSYDKPTVLIPRKGSISNLFYLENAFWNVDTIYYTEIDDKQIIPKYFYYYLTTIKLEEMAINPTRPSLTQAILDKVKIPIPSLEIQEKIVQILDKMTKYVTELTSELTSRKKQYSYYRDKLLSFEDEVYQVEWKTLGEVCDVRDGTHDSPNKKAFGKYLITSKNVKNGSINFDSAYFISESDFDNINKRSKVDIDDLLFTMIGTVGEVAHITEEADFAIKNVGLIKTQSRILARYLLHYLQSTYAKDYISGNSSKGSQVFLGLGKLRNFPIPYVEPKIQSRIVQVLDNFDKVCNDLNIGLPKEIELRQKQYEYFREKLLTFVAEGEYTESRVEEWDNSTLIKLLQWVFGPIRVELGSVFEVIAGGDIPKNGISAIETEEYRYPILSNGINEKSLYGWTNQARIKNPSLTVSARGTIGWTSYREKPFFPIVRLLVLTPKINLNLKYAYYFMRSIENNYEIPQSGIPQLTKPMIQSKIITLPPLEEQSSIVSILDNFNTLTDSLSEGLPKEIELRQKQYEYWREQLLNFTR